MFDEMKCRAYGRDWFLFGQYVGPEITLSGIDELIADLTAYKLEKYPDTKPNFCEACAMNSATCDCANPKHIYVK